jgi:hypothetical protein
LLHDQARVFQETLASRRQGNTAAVTNEEGSAEHLFHAPDALAGRGEREVSPSRTVRDAVSVRNMEKQTQINEIKTHSTGPSCNSTPVAVAACCAA